MLTGYQPALCIASRFSRNLVEETFSPSRAISAAPLPPTLSPTEWYIRIGIRPISLGAFAPRTAGDSGLRGTAAVATAGPGADRQRIPEGGNAEKGGEKKALAGGIYHY